MKKIKESGFTLIELLGTIVIIGILGTIAVTSVVNIKKSSNNRFDNSQVELMKQAGQTYFTDNKRLLPIVEGQTNYVTLDKLIEKGYINKLYNSKKEEFDPTTSYAWVQKQNDGSYKYDCYCEIKGEKLAGTTSIPESKANNSIVTFEYENFYNNKSENKYYTNGKNNSIVKVHLNRNEVSEYRYEIYKKDTNNEDSQYKISQREKLTSNLVNIKLNAKDYSDGEYFIKVTTYNSTGNSNQSNSSAKIYVDKTPPTCNITTTYQKDSNSVQNLWYSSKSKNSNNQELGANSKLPISVDGSDKGSGIKSGSKHIFSDSGYTKQIDKTGTYEAENTGKNGKEYYATIEDNVGNKAKCSQLYYIDTKPPACVSSGGSDTWKNATSDKKTTLTGTCNDADSGCIKGSTLERRYDDDGNVYWDITNEGSWTNLSPGTVYDEAGNSTECPGNQTVKHDWTPPTCNIALSDSDKGNNVEGIQWYRGNVTASLSITDEGPAGKSAVTPTIEGKASQTTITKTDNGKYTVNGKVIDEAGNSNTCQSAAFGIDKTKPVCIISTGTPHKNGWYTSNVNALITTTDDINNTKLSGIDGSKTKIKYGNTENASQVTVSDEGENKVINGEVHDNAGNTSTCSQTIKLDKTPPSCPDISVYASASSDSVLPKTWIHNKYSARVVIKPKADDASGLDKFEWLTKDDQNSTFSKQSTEENINTNTSYTKLLGNAEKYEGKATGQIKIYDKAGNVNNTCQTDEYWIDRKDPSIDVFSIVSDDSRYNTVTPDIKVEVNDKYNVKYGVYSASASITDDARKYTTKGSEVTIHFKELSPNRIDDFNGQTSAGYNGATYTIKVSAKDEAGNTSTKTAEYTVYTDCSVRPEVVNSACDAYAEGSCSNECGGGIQYSNKYESWSDPYTSWTCYNTIPNGCSQSCGGIVQTIVENDDPSECDVDCGDGTAYYDSTTTTIGIYGGICGQATTENIPVACNEGACPTKTCGAWSKCERKDGARWPKKTRKCGNETQTKKCNIGAHNHIWCLRGKNTFDDNANWRCTHGHRNNKHYKIFCSICGKEKTTSPKWVCPTAPYKDGDACDGFNAKWDVIK